MCVFGKNIRDFFSSVSLIIFYIVIKNNSCVFMFTASKTKNVQILPKTEDNIIQLETKSKESKTCGSPQYEIMKVRLRTTIIK